jgi:hypothetical protein
MFRSAVVIQGVGAGVLVAVDFGASASDKTGGDVDPPKLAQAVSKSAAINAAAAPNMFFKIAFPLTTEPTLDYWKSGGRR